MTAEEPDPEERDAKERDAEERESSSSSPMDKMADLGRGIGAYIRQQRGNAQISLRQLAKLAGVSNPYLSQIERGMRKPSAEILQQIAKGLRISAEALYVQAGILDQAIGGPVVDAIRADDRLSERQKRVLLDVYESFRRENDSNLESSSGPKLGTNSESGQEKQPQETPVQSTGARNPGSG